jgi:amino acid transporter
VLLQSTIAILILVGFESATTFAAEAKNPRRDIPRAVIISLVIQGVFAYLFQYFAANYALGSWLGNDVAGKGIHAAAASAAPIGDMAIQFGDSLATDNGFALMIILAFSVAIALLGTTLASMNTGVRISFAMAQDSEMPEIMGLLSGRYATPYMGIILMIIISALIGSIGVLGGAITLTGIALASNLGTFVLYGLICGVTFAAFFRQTGFSLLRHRIIPALGVIANAGMVLVIFTIGITSGGSTAQATYLALGIAGAWLLVSAISLIIASRQSRKPIIPPVQASAGGR